MIDPAASNLRRWRERPDIFVREVFHATPDPWQDDALRAFPATPRLAMKAAKGPGKSCLLAWIAWNFVLTRPHPRVGAMSITGANLKSNLWTELAVWRLRSPMLQAAFEHTGTEIFNREHPKTWKIEARTWAQNADKDQIGLALAGLHADYVMWLMDESGAYPAAILPTAEAIFAGNPIEAHIVQAGNANSLTGPLYHACTTARALWHVIEITGDPDDPKRSSRISIDYARDQIRQYGRNNPWVKVSILGEFPPSSPNTLIGPDDMSAAMKRYYREGEIGASPRILGVDVARYGDDASVIFPRQGIQALKPIERRGINSIQGAGLVSRVWREWDADACFVDDTGGFGSGWIDQLRLLGRTPIGVQFSAAASNYERYHNKRTEMYFDAAEWVKAGGALPECPELTAAMTNTTYMFHGDKLLLEPKDDVKAKIGYSPDHADAFVETFAEPVQPRADAGLPRMTPRHQAEYDPFREFAQAPAATRPRHLTEWEGWR